MEHDHYQFTCLRKFTLRLKIGHLDTICLRGQPLLVGNKQKALRPYMLVSNSRSLQLLMTWLNGGTAAAAPLPFRPSEPALCGSCPLVTPY